VIPPRRAAIFAAVTSATLERGVPYWWRPRGVSMVPVVHDGDRVLIAPATPDRLRPGDVVKFTLDGEFRLHRLVRRVSVASAGQRFELQGDNAASPDPLVAAAAIVGIAVAVERAGRVRRLDTPWARARGWLRAWRQRRSRARGR
jgi:Peptidase S24-like